MALKASSKITREDDKVYVQEADLTWLVWVGREEKPNRSYESAHISDPDASRQRGIYFVLEYQEDGFLSGVVSNFSTFCIRDSWQKAHDLAMDVAVSLVTPLYEGHQQKHRKVIDLTRSVPVQESGLVEVITRDAELVL